MFKKVPSVTEYVVDPSALVKLKLPLTKLLRVSNSEIVSVPELTKVAVPVKLGLRELA